MSCRLQPVMMLVYSEWWWKNPHYGVDLRQHTTEAGYMKMHEGPFVTKFCFALFFPRIMLINLARLCILPRLMLVTVCHWQMMKIKFISGNLQVLHVGDRFGLFGKSHQNFNSVSNIRKSSPTFSHQHHYRHEFRLEIDDMLCDIIWSIYLPIIHRSFKS